MSPARVTVVDYLIGLVLLSVTLGDRRRPAAGRRR